MPETPKTDFTLQEVAFAYAICAERLVASDPNVLNTHFGTVPVLVHLLYQSLEISLKQIGGHFNLLDGNDPKGRRLADQSHDIQALTVAIQSGFPGHDVLALLTATVSDDSLGTDFLAKMLTAPEFADTRLAYRKRTLGYAELQSFTIFSSHFQEWIRAVKDTAQNLERFIGLLELIIIKPTVGPKVPST